MAFVDIGFRWRSGRNAEVPGKFFGSIFGADAEQFGGEVNDIAAGVTAEAVEPLIQFQAGVMIFMEGAQCHSMDIHFQPVPFGGLPGCHRLFYGFKNFQVISPSLLLHFVRYRDRIYEHLF
jgi:hypothetical protein